jgi:hypothetical protein
MLAWILYFIFKNGWTNQKAGKRPASIASNRSRLLRKSIKDLSAEVGAPNTFRTQKPRHQQWFDGVNCLFEPDQHIFERIFQYLDPSDAVKILSLWL